MLEGAGDAERGDGFRRKPREGALPKADLAGVR